MANLGFFKVLRIAWNEPLCIYPYARRNLEALKHGYRRLLSG